MDLKPDLKKFHGARVVVAMSGGVDSSTAAALLVDAGCEVIGVSMKLWDSKLAGPAGSNLARCCADESFEDARRVAQRMGFPFRVFDFSADFHELVIGDFVDEYRVGRTPNPCVVCNTKMKWAVLAEHARRLGADFLATGHYARIDYGDHQRQPQLQRGIDPDRDQSYFLWGIPEGSLRQTIFPLGSLVKDDVRRLAREFGLRNAARPESREICFVPDDDYGRFLREQTELSATPGEIKNAAGETVGRHDGVAFYTIGQRKGIGAHGKPVYVTALDAPTNTVFIGANDNLQHQLFVVDELNWISIPSPTVPMSVSAQIRYKHQAAAAQIYPESEVVRVVFDNPQRAITPGQSAVFYQGDIVLGGGRIKHVIDAG